MEAISKKINFPLFFKLLLLSGILVIVIVIVWILFFYSYNRLSFKDKFTELIINYNEISKNISSMERRMRENLHLTFADDTSKIRRILQFMDDLSRVTELTEDTVFIDEFKEYRDNINSFIKNLKEIGLTEDVGLEGHFRSNIHKLEKLLFKSKDFASLYYLLQARRREKDFMMRHKKEYAEKVKENIKLLANRLNRVYRAQDSANIYLRNYISSFDKYLEVYQNLKASYLSIQENERKLDSLFKNKYFILNQQAEIAHQITSPIVIVAILFGILLTLFYARTITKPVSELQKATLQVAKGNLKVKVALQTNDEFSLLGDFFNNMVQSIEQNNKLILQQNEELKEFNEELKTLNATKDKLFSIIAHDLKNPLASFKSAMEHLSENYYKLSDDEKIEFLQAINTSANSVYELLENLLQWSLSQRNKTPYQPHSFNIKYVADMVIEQLKLQAENKKIKLYNEIDGNIEVFADINMITIVLRNLLSNAIKFTNESGFVRLGCQVDKQNNHCLVSVEDNGIGIPPEVLGKLFRIDTSISSRGTRNEAGTGLGLIICKEYVEKNGGKIWVESRLNAGTTFYFTLPLGSELHQ
ncbi:MAG: HAMP domain-containing histidine kinase [Ignavibacteria bacterium]|nr:HAMP domain-containing histidine kinase [Ignavibacteria bacterium]